MGVRKRRSLPLGAAAPRPETGPPPSVSRETGDCQIGRPYAKLARFVRNESPVNDATSHDGDDAVRRKAMLSLTALGVVYGDIGTSPLYAIHECFFGGQPLQPVPATVLGILSLIFWSLILVISVKYLAFIMRADNHGEGGILALLASLEPWQSPARRNAVLIALGLFGASLLYGDGMITPAISVLSSVEGLKVAAPGLVRFVLPLTVSILILLFLFQRRGTAAVGVVFGPIMLLWFAVLAVLGLYGIAAHPAVLRAVDPLYAIEFFIHNGMVGFFTLGAVFLVVTGGETVYADMGHFGRFPVRFAWFAVVLPALLLNYFGQGASLLAQPGDVVHPFYSLAPDWARFPLVALATVATVIASQAVISGAFSLANQAVQLGQSPRLHIVQTSAAEAGQIFIPSVNLVLMIATIGLVLGFRSSSNLAGAYGMAVSTTMLITTVLAFFVMRETWKWPLGLAVAVVCGFLILDLAFFFANLAKIPEGGWFPMVVAVVIYGGMQTWCRGRQLLWSHRGKTPPVVDFIDSLRRDRITRVPGTAVFLISHGYWPNTPPVLTHHLEHIHSMHERVILLTVVTDRVPRVPAAARLEVERLRGGFFWVVAHYGFMQTPNVPVALRLCEEQNLIPKLAVDEIVYFVGRTILIPTEEVPGMAVWRERLFAYMTRNALSATAFYSIPPEQVVELGIQVEI